MKHLRMTVRDYNVTSAPSSYCPIFAMKMDFFVTNLSIMNICRAKFSIDTTSYFLSAKYATTKRFWETTYLMLKIRILSILYK